VIPDVVKAKLSSVNQTTLLTGIGISGVITTSYLSGRASFKAAEIIRNEDHHEKPLTTKEKIHLVWPLYVAPVSVGTTTITAIAMANHTASKKIAALTAGMGVSERVLQEYKEKVIEKFGEGKAQQVRDEIAQDRIRNNPPDPSNTQVLMVGDGDVLCHDLLTGRYFMSSAEKLRQAMNNLNYEIIAHEYASLSFFYDLIGLAPTAYSDYVGWRVDDHPEITFSTVMSPDDRPCIAVDFEAAPHPGYSSLY
jgi:hypothetical protein